MKVTTIPQILSTHSTFSWSSTDPKRIPVVNDVSGKSTLTVQIQAYRATKDRLYLLHPQPRNAISHVEITLVPHDVSEYFLKTAFHVRVHVFF